MRDRQRIFAALAAALVLSGCSSSEGVTGEPGQSGRSIASSLVNVEPEPAGNNCPNGGSRITAGLDINRNSLLDNSEITQSRYACNASSVSLMLVRTNPEPNGTRCSTGGYSIRAGFDANDNKVLDDNEVSVADVVCNGPAGQNGIQGLTSLMTTNVESPGIPCSQGGTRYNTGLDVNGNSILEVEEITSKSYVCNGNNVTNGSHGIDGANALTSLILTSTEPSGINCNAGGLRVQTGLDINRSGVLDTAEIMSTAYICNTEGIGTQRWAASSLISSAGAGAAAAPQIAIDSLGNGLAVWQQSDGTRLNIWSSRYTANMGWSTATLVELDNTGDASSPHIAMTPDGNAMATWQQVDGSGIVSIYANRFSVATGQWGTPEIIETGAGDAFHPKIALDGIGNALAVWSQSDGIRTNIWVNRYSQATNRWDTAQLIETDNQGSATSPQIAMNSSGNAIAVWEQQDTTGLSNIWANRFTPHIGWETAVLIETGHAGPAQMPQIAMDASNNAVAVWQQSDGLRFSIWANRFTISSRWGNAVKMQTHETADAISPHVAIDGIGRAMVVWDQSDGTRSIIYANRLPAGSNVWGTSTPIDSSEGLGIKPRIAFDASGVGLVVWQHAQGTGTPIKTNKFSPQTGWGWTLSIGPAGGTGHAASAQVAMNAGGDALAIWQQSDGQPLQIGSNCFGFICR